MKTIYDVTELIPTGHENAITLAELMGQTDLNERSIRDAISKSHVLIINLQDGKGYFKPAEDERELVEEWKALTRSRIRDLSRRERQACNWLAK